MGSEQMSKMNNKGYIAGAITWLLVTGFAVSRFDCLNYNRCGGDDIFLAAVMGIGMIGPAYIVALLFSNE